MDDNPDSSNSDGDSNSSSNNDSDSDSDEAPLGSDLIAAATGSFPIIARSNQPIPAAQIIDPDDSGSDTLLKTAIRGNRRGRPREQG